MGILPKFCHGGRTVAPGDLLGGPYAPLPWFLVTLSLCSLLLLDLSLVAHGNPSKVLPWRWNRGARRLPRRPVGAPLPWMRLNGMSPWPLGTYWSGNTIESISGLFRSWRDGCRVPGCGPTSHFRKSAQSTKGHLLKFDVLPLMPLWLPGPCGMRTCPILRNRCCFLAPMGK